LDQDHAREESAPRHTCSVEEMRDPAAGLLQSSRRSFVRRVRNSGTGKRQGTPDPNLFFLRKDRS